MLWLCAVRQQAITWANVGHMASLGLNDLYAITGLKAGNLADMPDINKLYMQRSFPGSRQLLNVLRYIVMQALIGLRHMQND